MDELKAFNEIDADKLAPHLYQNYRPNYRPQARGIESIISLTNQFSSVLTSTDFDISKSLERIHGSQAPGNQNQSQNASQNSQQLRLDNFARGGSVFEGDRDINVGRQRQLAQDFMNRVRDAEE